MVFCQWNRCTREPVSTVRVTQQVSSVWYQVVTNISSRPITHVTQEVGSAGCGLLHAQALVVMGMAGAS